MPEESIVVAAQEVRVAIGRVARRLRQIYALVREDAPSFTEIAILVRLDRDGPSSPSALAGHERVTSQAIAGVVRELERRSLITRRPDQDDRRRVVIAITGAGRRLLRDREHAVVEALVRSLAEDFTAAELRRLTAVVPLLNRLADRL
jgi:DNA-binding MarR family transcriptional regulator